MEQLKLGLVEGHFADIVWENAPMTTRELVRICEQKLQWKRTTTYTVLKKLCNRGIFATNDSIVTVLITKSEFNTIQSEQFVRNNFQGSLPAFLAAFTARSVPSQRDLEQIRQMIDAMSEEAK